MNNEYKFSLSDDFKIDFKFPNELDNTFLDELLSIRINPNDRKESNENILQLVYGYIHKKKIENFLNE